MGNYSSCLAIWHTEHCGFSILRAVLQSFLLSPQLQELSIEIAPPRIQKCLSNFLRPCRLSKWTCSCSWTSFVISLRP